MGVEFADCRIKKEAVDDSTVNLALLQRDWEEFLRRFFDGGSITILLSLYARIFGWPMIPFVISC